MKTPPADMSALVIGKGSIGARHARVLAGLGVRTAVVSRRPGEGEFVDLGMALAVARPDYAVVATETTDHRRVLDALAEAGFSGSVLVEKPLFARDESLPRHDFAALLVGYPLRFHPALRALRDRLEGERVLSAQLYVGQYLPDWRPGRDYRKVYSAKTAQGGGALRDLSHELDLAQWLFGPWLGLGALGGTWSDLEIDADDVFVLLAEFTRCPAATIHLNYLDRGRRREILVNTATHTHTLDLVAGALRCDTGAPEAFSVDADHLLRSMHVAALNGETDVCSADGGRQVLAMIGAAEQAAAERRWVVAPPSDKGCSTL